MTTAKKLITAEDLLMMSEIECRYELVKGQLIALPFSDMAHGFAAAQIGYALSEHRTTVGGIAYLGNTGIILQRNPDTVRAPDACYFAPGREPRGSDAEGYPEVVPDLIVEIWSFHDAPGEFLGKIGEWLTAGVRLVWAVYPDRSAVVAFRSLTDIRVYSGDDILDAEPVLTGFACPVARLFQ